MAEIWAWKEAGRNHIFEHADFPKFFKSAIPVKIQPRQPISLHHSIDNCPIIVLMCLKSGDSFWFERERQRKLREGSGRSNMSE